MGVLPLSDSSGEVRSVRESLESDQVRALVGVLEQVGNRAQTGYALDGWTGA